MGCRCGKTNRTTMSIRSVAPLRSTSTRAAVVPSQLQALTLKAAEQSGNQPKNDFEKRRTEKLRREAIRRTLGKG